MRKRCADREPCLHCRGHWATQEPAHSVAAHLFFIRGKYRHELCAQIWLDGNQTLQEASSESNPKPNHVFTGGCRGPGTLRVPWVCLSPPGIGSVTGVLFLQPQAATRKGMRITLNILLGGIIA